jgi:hypothetical protein
MIPFVDARCRVSVPDPRDAETAALRAEVDQYRATVDSLVGGLFPDHGFPKATAAEACKDLVAIVQHGAKEQVRLEAEVERLTRENSEARAWSKNLTDRAGFKSRAETAEARVAVLEEAVLCALNHAGQCLCCRRWYEDSQDAATRSTAQHDEDCYISVCRSAAALSVKP